MINNEQIQALKAAADSCDKQEPLSLVVYHGKMCLRNKGGIVFTVLRDICFPDYSAENENYARLAEACTPDLILSLLAEREADKALIAESVVLFETLRQRIAELEREKDAMTAAALAMRDDMREDRTLTVKLPKRATADKYVDGTFDNSDLAAIYNTCRLECEVKIKNACAAAGITLVVGE